MRDRQALDPTLDPSWLKRNRDELAELISRRDTGALLARQEATPRRHLRCVMRRFLF